MIVTSVRTSKEPWIAEHPLFRSLLERRRQENDYRKPASPPPLGPGDGDSARVAPAPVEVGVAVSRRVLLCW